MSHATRRLIPLIALALASCDGTAPLAVDPPRDPTPPVRASHGEPHVDTRNVNTSVAYGTVTFEGICRDGFEVVRAGTTLSGELVERIAAGEHPATFTPGAGFGALLAPFGPLANFDFLTQNVAAGYAELGDAANQIEDLAHDLAAALTTERGIPFVADVVVTSHGQHVYSLFGAVLVTLPDGTVIRSDDPDFLDDFEVPPGADVTLVPGLADIHFYTVSVVIRRADGAPAPCARQLKASARDLLTAHAGHPDRKVEKRIEKALDRLEKSLDPDLWIDDGHLVPKKGKKVFDEEKKAAHEVMKLLDKATEDDDPDDGKYDLDPAAIADLEAALEAMLEADRQLASTALAEVDCAGERKCEKELEKAGRHFARAESRAAEDRADKAIGEFRKAWEKAGKAAKEAAG